MTAAMTALEKVLGLVVAAQSVPLSELTLPVDLLAEAFGELPAASDFTVANVAKRLGRAQSTVRSWIQAGDLRAYRLRGREYRVTPAALEEFLATEREGRPKNSSSSKGRAVDLGRWRKERAV